jgi:O-antigen/teichoic acid export membrane protein
MSHKVMLRNLAKDTSIYGGGDFVAKMLAFVSFPMIAAALSPREFGALELLGTITALLGIFSSFGLNNAVQRFYWEKDVTSTTRPVIVSSGLTILAISSFSVGIFTVFGGLHFFNEWISEERIKITEWAFICAIGLMISSNLLVYILDILRLHFASFRFLILSLFHQVLIVVSGFLVVVVHRKGVDGLLFAQMIVTFAMFIPGLWMIRRDITTALDFLGWGKQLIMFGYPFIFAGLAYWLFSSMDRWMLTFMNSVEETGIYSVAFRFSSVIIFINTAFGRAWSPYAIKVKTEFSETYRIIYARSLLNLLFFTMMIGGALSLFSGELINLLMPKEYSKSAPVLSILCLGLVLQGTQQITAIGISIERKTYLFAIMAWITASLNFVLNWLLIPQFGAAGAAWATTISYSSLTASYLYFTQKLHPMAINWIKLIRILVLGGLLFCTAILCSSLEWQWSNIALKMTILITVFLIGWPVLGVDHIWKQRKNVK